MARRLLPLFVILVAGCGGNPPPTSVPASDPKAVNDDQVEATRIDVARVSAETIQIAAKTWITRNDGQELTDLALVVPYLEGGQNALLDPWGGKYQCGYAEDKPTGRRRLFIWTVHPKTGKKIGAPQSLENEELK